MCNLFEKYILQKSNKQCLAGFLMIIHQERMKLAGTRSEKAIRALFLNRKGMKKGCKIDFQKFQHAMLWGVYPEVPKEGAKWWWATFLYMMEAISTEVKHFERNISMLFSMYYLHILRISLG